MSDPITQSYLQSDLIGRAIFIALWLLSIISWSVIIYRAIGLWNAQQSDRAFLALFQSNKHRALNFLQSPEGIDPGPMTTVYQHLRSYTLDLLAKNRQFGAVDAQTGAAYLSMDDVQMINERAGYEIQSQIHKLEAYIHHLSTIVALAPFLGLLGTVWGILTSLSSMSGSSNDAILTGLAMALATTVIGLVVAIPALLGYNAFKAWLKKFELSLDNFSSHAINVIELQYRKVTRETQL